MVRRVPTDQGSALDLELTAAVFHGASAQALAVVLYCPSGRGDPQRDLSLLVHHVHHEGVFHIRKTRVTTTNAIDI